MKLLINNKYQDVGFWSLMKCFILVDLALLGIIYGAVFALAILLPF